MDADAPGGALHCPGRSAVRGWQPEHGLCDPGAGGSVWAGVGAWRRRCAGARAPHGQGRAWGPFASDSHGRTLSIGALQSACRPGPWAVPVIRQAQGSGAFPTARPLPGAAGPPASPLLPVGSKPRVPRRAAVLPALRHRSLCEGCLVPWRFQCVSGLFPVTSASVQPQGWGISSGYCNKHTSAAGRGGGLSLE